MMRLWSCTVPVLLLASPAMSVPPPPPPPGTAELASKITDTFKPDKFDDYAKLFADNLKVYKNGEVIAEDKAAWLVVARKMAESWRIEKRDTALSRRGVLITETINNMRPYRPGVVSDCCYWARSALYTLNDQNLISEVRFLESGGYWGKPDKPE